MDQETKIAQMLAIFGELYDKEITEPLVRIYAKMLGDVPDAELEAMTEHCLAECHWFPKPADFLGFRRKQVAIEADEAWNLVLKTAASPGRKRSVQFMDRRIGHALAAVGGFHHVCNSTVVACQTTLREAFKARFGPVGDEMVFEGTYPSEPLLVGTPRQEQAAMKSNQPRALPGRSTT
jgi:hypothetical protein